MAVLATPSPFHLCIPTKDWFLVPPQLRAELEESCDDEDRTDPEIVRFGYAADNTEHMRRCANNLLSDRVPHMVCYLGEEVPS